MATFAVSPQFVHSDMRTYEETNYGYSVVEPNLPQLSSLFSKKRQRAMNKQLVSKGKLKKMRE